MVLLAISPACGPAPALSPPLPTVRLVPPPGSGADLRLASFDVLHLGDPTLRALAEDGPGPDGWATILGVSIDDGPPTHPPSGTLLEGSYRVARVVLRFTPREPLVPGLRYRVDFHPERLPRMPSGTGWNSETLFFSLNPLDDPEPPGSGGHPDEPAGDFSQVEPGAISLGISNPYLHSVGDSAVD